MKTTTLFAVFCAIILGMIMLLGDPVSASGPASPEPGSQEFYTTQVMPILQKNCLRCHSDPAKAGLHLDSYAGILQGGDDGAVIVKGDPNSSMLIQAVERTGDLAMPPKSVLDPADVATLAAWVKAGAAGGETPAASNAAPAQADKNAAAPAGPDASLKNVSMSEDPDFFENKVRPIFANSCYSCHTDQASGGFQLDTKDHFEKGGSRGAEVVPGDPDKSRLVQAVEQTGSLKMPRGGPKLSETDIATLAAWVKAGAKWPAKETNTTFGTTATTGIITDQQRKFWPFLPLKPVDTPPVTDRHYAHWVKTPIDNFILANLQKNGLAPAPQADRRALIRRATYNLTGLPPTQEEVEVFEHDRSPNAWEKVIDRLLASPRYGERWGRHWLDVARYSEDDVRGLDPKGRGYMPFDGAYRFRDWVIKAFNDDLPYDKFQIMQLAGDRLPAKTAAERNDNLIATTYLGAGPWVWDQAEPVQGRADERNERVDAVTRGMLGLTVACARCHNHKYDAIAQKDYYKIVSIFASSTYKVYPVVSPASEDFYNKKVLQEATLRADLRDYTTDLSKQLAGALAAQTTDYLTAAWSVLGKEKKTVEEASSNAKLDPEVLQRWVDYLPKEHVFPYLKDWNAMTAAPDNTEEQARVLGEAFQKELLRVFSAADDIKRQNDIIKAKGDVPERRVVLDTNPGKFDTFDEFCPGCQLELKALPTNDAKLYQEIFVTQSGEQEEKFKPGVLVFTGWSLTRRLGEPFQSYITAQQKKIADLDKNLKDTTYPYVNGETDKPKPVDVNLNIRGNPHSLGPVVQRGFLTVLSPPEAKPYTDGSGRLEFAQDVANHPLAARVIVNRIWEWHFGTGIVNTPDNFGVMGDKPSNPELLEWLAWQFVQHGRSIKWLQKEIMMSAVYQTSVDESPEAHDKDGGNRLYSHFNRQRLDAEEIRDSLLFVAGDLDLKNTSGPSEDFTADNLRRTVFCKVSRFRLNNYLMIFDFPNPSFTSEQRFSSNVPLQQLYYMNNPFVYKQSGVLADRVHNAPTDEARIEEAYEYVLQRKPTAQELQLGLKFLSTTPDKPGYEVADQPITAWSEYAHVLMSSNEFQFVN